MNDKQIYFAFSEAGNYKDVDAFISDISLSSAMEDITITDTLLEQLRNIWKCYHYSIKEISEITGLSQTQISTRYMIPLRTVQHWFNGDREIPMYIKLMVCENLGLWKR